jgi:phage-related protein
MEPKALKWVGSSYEDLNDFPKEVCQAMGYALHLAQIEEKHVNAKIFKGMGNAKVLEVRENDRSGTYRVLYTLEIKEFVFVLHAFQKKSKSGIATPQEEIDLVHSRLKDARGWYKELTEERKNATKSKK